MQNPGTPTDETLWEIREHGSVRYPMEFYRTHYFQGEVTSLHWHREFELVYIERGSLLCRLCCESIILREGQALWIAPGLLHGYEGCEESSAISFLFLPELFAAEGSLLHERFIQPLRALKAEHCLMDGSQPWHAEALSILPRMIRTWDENSETRELDFQSQLTQFWSLLYQNRDCLVTGSSTEATMRMQARFVSMTEYIETHFREKLMLAQIARAANISRSEALRCFRTLAGQTPVEYLLKYRLRQARKLLISTEKSITEVAQSTGFESVAYFDRVFRREYNCTPRQMRRQHAADA